MKREKVNAAQLIEVIHAKQGVVTAVAQAMNIHRKTVYDYAKRYKTVKQALQDARTDYDSTLLDEAELKLRQATRNGEPWAVRYVLDKKGRSRGYIDKQEIEHTGEQVVTHIRENRPSDD